MDPLQTKGKSSSDTTPLKFAKLLSPKMKSVYWPYFGFPTNENDRIITKQNVVCTLCHKVLTNHGNTTNLRAHLQHRHKDIFKRVCSENGIQIPPRRIAKPTNDAYKSKREPIGRKVKVEYDENMQDSSSTRVSLGVEEQGMLYETMIPITYEDDEVIEQSEFAKVEVSDGRTLSRKDDISDEVEVICPKIDTKNNSNYTVDLLEDISPFQMPESLVNMLIQDLRPVDSVYDPGMVQLMRNLNSNIILPSKNKIESLIKELHSDRLTILGDQFKVHSQLKPFSLGFEIWTNVEQKHFLSVYFNYTTESPEYNLMNQLYTTFEYNKFTVLESFLEDFNLVNCTAAIVNYEYTDDLKDYLRDRNIPIILSYDVTVDTCLKNVFDLPAVAVVLEEVKEVITRHCSEINSKNVEIPVINMNFPWTCYDLLRFFSESVSWPEDLDVLVSSAKLITDTLNTLAITLDTLKGEEIPHSSMLSPITAKILDKKLAMTSNDEDLITAIKTSITEDLQKLVISDDHLTISALLDPRFHRLTNINNFGNILQILTTKLTKICDFEGYSTSVGKSENRKKESGDTNKKSNLELFFDIQENKTTESLEEESNIETDFKRYKNEVFVSLDESPFLWWKKVGHLYGTLSKLAWQYQCVPAVVQMSFRKPTKQQMYEYQKRYMLAGNLIDAMLFLNYNGK